MTRGSEIDFLKALNRGDRQRICQLVMRHEIDASQLRDFLDAEQLSTYVHSGLDQLGLLNLFPENFRQHLDWQRQDQRRRNQEIGTALLALHKSLQTQGIDFIVAKGLPLAEIYWAGADNRFSWDLDVLVKPEDRRQAMRALATLGFEAPQHSRLLGGMITSLVHGLEHKNKNLAIDLHWAFRQRPGLNLDYPGAWERGISWQHGGLAFTTTGTPDTLRILLLGVALDIERGSCSYRKLWDIYLWLQRESDFDWQAFSECSAAEGSQDIVINMLALTTLALGCAGEFPGLDQLLADESSRVIVSAAIADALLHRRSRYPHGRLLFARLQPAPKWRYLSWWTATAPLRYALGRA